VPKDLLVVGAGMELTTVGHSITPLTIQSSGPVRVTDLPSPRGPLPASPIPPPI
jgi:hypothetical protein